VLCHGVVAPNIYALTRALSRNRPLPAEGEKGQNSSKEDDMKKKTMKSKPAKSLKTLPAKKLNAKTAKAVKGGTTSLSFAKVSVEYKPQKADGSL
jgi:hypothetical protein